MMQDCMELIFEKAVDEPGFSVAYARMCQVLLIMVLLHGTLVCLWMIPSSIHPSIASAFGGPQGTSGLHSTNSADHK